MLYLVGTSLIRAPVSPCTQLSRRRHAWPVARNSVPVTRASANSASDPRTNVEVEDFFSTPAPYDLWGQHTHRMDRVLKEVEAMQRQMDRDFEGAMARAEELAQHAQQQQEGVVVRRGNGWQSYSRQHSYEGTSSRGYYSERVVVVGPTPAAPPPAVHTDALWFAVLATAFLTGAWAVATRAFNRNYHLTSYSEGERWKLLLMWPVLLLVSPAFRQQFWAAARGRRPGRPEGEAPKAQQGGSQEEGSNRAAAAQ